MQATTILSGLPAGMVPLSDVTPTNLGSLSVSGSVSQSAEGSGTAAPPVSATPVQIRRHSASELQQQPVSELSGGRGSVGVASAPTAGAVSRAAERGRQRGRSAGRAATKEKNKQAQQRCMPSPSNRTALAAFQHKSHSTCHCAARCSSAVPRRVEASPPSEVQLGVCCARRWRDRQREKMQQSNALVATMQQRVQEMQCEQVGSCSACV